MPVFRKVQLGVCSHDYRRGQCPSADQHIAYRANFPLRQPLEGSRLPARLSEWKAEQVNIHVCMRVRRYVLFQIVA